MEGFVFFFTGFYIFLEDITKISEKNNRPKSVIDQNIL